VALTDHGSRQVSNLHTSTLNEIALSSKVRPDLNHRTSHGSRSANIVSPRTLNKTLRLGLARTGQLLVASRCSFVDPGCRQLLLLGPTDIGVVRFVCAFSWRFFQLPAQLPDLDRGPQFDLSEPRLDLPLPLCCPYFGASGPSWGRLPFAPFGAFLVRPPLGLFLLVAPFGALAIWRALASGFRVDLGRPSEI